jgi:Zn-dependent protease
VSKITAEKIVRNRKVWLGGLLLLLLTLIGAIYLFTNVFGVPEAAYVTILGISTQISIWSLLLFAFFLYTGMTRQAMHQSESSNATLLFWGVAYSVGVLLSVVMHEFSHGFVSQVIFGNPIKSAGIGFWYAFVEPSVSVGQSAVQEVLIPLAGPLSNIAFGLLVLLILRKPNTSNTVTMLRRLASLNLSLAELNLIPISFLDGGQALKGLLKLVHRDTEVIYLLSGAILIALYLILKDSFKPTERWFKISY